ncbi:MAG: hypothetical protein ACPGWR_05800 [Ardenticatenaceae bacterium]
MTYFQTWKHTRAYQFRWLLIVSLLFVGLFGAVGSAEAFDFIDGATIEKGTKIDDDVFIAGEKVVVNGEINGDLFALGQNVTINGTVKGSLFTTGQNIIIDGKVEGSLYGGAASLILDSDAEIGRNLLFGGFGLETRSGSKVARDLLMGGYQAQLAGTVGRNVNTATAALEISGKVDGDVDANVGTPEDSAPTSLYFGPGGGEMPDAIDGGLRVTSDAEIKGKLSYNSSVDQTDAIEATPTGGVFFEQVESEQSEEPQTTSEQVQAWLTPRIGDFLTLLVLGGVLLWRLPNPFLQMIHKASNELGSATLWGVLTLIGGWIAIAILGILFGAIGVFLTFITFGGLGITVFGLGISAIVFILTLFLLLVTYGSKVVAAYLGAHLIFSRIPKLNNKYLPLIVGIILYMLLRAIPYLGPVISFIATLIGLGAMWLQYRNQDDVKMGEMPIA